MRLEQAEAEALFNLRCANVLRTENFVEVRTRLIKLSCGLPLAIVILTARLMELGGDWRTLMRKLETRVISLIDGGVDVEHFGLHVAITESLEHLDELMKQLQIGHLFAHSDSNDVMSQHYARSDGLATSRYLALGAIRREGRASVGLLRYLWRAPSDEAVVELGRQLSKLNLCTVLKNKFLKLHDLQIEYCSRNGKVNYHRLLLRSVSYPANPFSREVDWRKLSQQKRIDEFHPVHSTWEEQMVGAVGRRGELEEHEVQAIRSLIVDKWRTLADKSVYAH